MSNSSTTAFKQDYRSFVCKTRNTVMTREGQENILYIQKTEMVPPNSDFPFYDNTLVRYFAISVTTYRGFIKPITKKYHQSKINIQ